MFSEGKKTARAVSLTYMIIHKLCFPAGTLVLMADGSLAAIESIEPGDQVLCDMDPHEHNGPEVGEVVRVFRNAAAETQELTLEVDGELSCLTTTPEHPFYSASSGCFVPARELSPGEVLEGRDGGPIKVVTSAPLEQNMEVYNLEVEPGHDYYVTPTEAEHGLLVHNSCVGHHTVPVAVMEKLNAAVRRAGPVHGMKGQKNIWQIPEELHKKLHGGGPRGGVWNDAWWKELGGEKGAAKATVEDIVRIREKLIKQFNLEEFRP